MSRVENTRAEIEISAHPKARIKTALWIQAKQMIAFCGIEYVV